MDSALFAPQQAVHTSDGRPFPGGEATANQSGTLGVVLSHAGWARAFGQPGGQGGRRSDSGAMRGGGGGGAGEAGYDGYGNLVGWGIAGSEGSGKGGEGIPVPFWGECEIDYCPRMPPDN